MNPWQLYHWHFEVSGRCTLKFPRCPRNDTAPVPWMNQELDLDFFQRLFSVDMLTNQVRRITMCGDIGDPIYASQYLDIVAWIKSINPRIHIFTITNGSYRRAEWWQRFAEISNEYDTINFSVDGYDHDSNRLYRANSDWSSIQTGMRIMCQNSNIFVNWAAIVFAFNQQHLDTMRQQARDLGCDGFQITKSTKFGSKYGDAYGGVQDPLEPSAQWVSSTHRYERSLINLSGRQPPIQDYLALNRVRFQEAKAQYNQMIRPMCSIGNRGLYVSADGVLHPCSWVSFPYVSMSTPRKTIRFENSFHQVYRDQLNLRTHSLKQVINDPVWHKLFGTFNDPDKAWVECEQKCSVDLVDENYAVGWLTN